MAYEKLDKLVLALNDYDAIKHLNPGNFQASQGLNRIHKLMSHDSELRDSVMKSREKEDRSIILQEPPKQNLNINFEVLEKQKQHGNELFKQSKLSKLP